MRFDSLGVRAYGLGGIVTDDDRMRVHGHDERMSIEGMGKLVEFIYGVVCDVDASE